MNSLHATQFCLLTFTLILLSHLGVSCQSVLSTPRFSPNTCKGFNLSSTRSTCRILLMLLDFIHHDSTRRWEQVSRLLVIRVSPSYCGNACVKTDIWIYINNCPTRCDTKQSIYYSASSFYLFRVSITLIIRRTQNCNYSLRYCAATSLQRSQGSATLEGGSCKKI